MIDEKESNQTPLILFTIAGLLLIIFSPYMLESPFNSILIGLGAIIVAVCTFILDRNEKETKRNLLPPKFIAGDIVRHKANNFRYIVKRSRLRHYDSRRIYEYILASNAEKISRALEFELELLSWRKK